MDAMVLNGEITSRRELVVQIPSSIAPGAVQVILLRTSAQKFARRRARRKIAHPAFGLWAKRDDITDSASFAAELRQRLESRGDGSR